VACRGTRRAFGSWTGRKNGKKKAVPEKRGPVRLSNRQIKQEGDFPVLVPITSQQHKLAAAGAMSRSLEVRPSASKIVDLGPPATETLSSSGSDFSSGGIAPSSDVKMRPAKPHEVRQAIASREVDKDEEQRRNGLLTGRVFSLRARDVEALQSRDKSANPRGKDFEGPALAPGERGMLNEYRNQGVEALSVAEPSGQGADEAASDFSVFSAPIGSRRAPRPANPFLQHCAEGSRRASREDVEAKYKRERQVERARSTSAVENSPGAFEEDADFFRKNFRDRDRRADGRSARELESLLSALPAAPGTAEEKPAEVRVSPRVWWFRQAEVEFRHLVKLPFEESCLASGISGSSALRGRQRFFGEDVNDEEGDEQLSEEERDQKVDIYDCRESPQTLLQEVPFMKAVDLKRLMMLLAHVWRKRAGVSLSAADDASEFEDADDVEDDVDDVGEDAEDGFSRRRTSRAASLESRLRVRGRNFDVIWAALVKRAHELTFGVSVAGGMASSNARVEPCHVRSTLRFLQAIASVQYLPSDARGEAMVVPSAANAAAKKQAQLVRERLESNAADERGHLPESDMGHEDDLPMKMRSCPQQRMVQQMLHSCIDSGRLKQQHYFFLLQVYARLRLRELPKKHVMLQKMSVCWSLLPQKQLVKVANCVAKLDLAELAWAKLLKTSLKALVFGTFSKFGE